MSRPDVIATFALSKRHGREAALATINLRVPDGAVYVLVGANGAGKSTALKVLMNLERADEGAAHVLGLDTARRGPEARAQIGYVPERADQPYRRMTCAQLLRHTSAYYPSWDGRYADELIAALGVRRDRRVGTLSKGESRRLQLVLALAHRPPVLLLDEPTDGLDPLVRARLLSMLAEHMADTPTTVLISTHQIHELESLADHVGVLCDGALVAQLSRDELPHRVGRFRVELPSGWQVTPELHAAGARAGAARETQWTLVGDRRELIGRLTISGAFVHEVQPLTLEGATLALLTSEAGLTPAAAGQRDGVLHPALHATPGWRTVLAAQVRSVGLALRIPIRVACTVAAIVSLLVVPEVLRTGDALHFRPEHHTLPGLLGLLLPIAVWKNEDHFGAGFLWTVPVDRFRHALIRVLAGWAWLMAAVALFVLWLLAGTLASGATPLSDEIRLFLPSFSQGVTFDPSDIQHVGWTSQPVLWLVPFTSATGTYLLASALALGARHPLRWLVGAIAAVFVLIVVGTYVSGPDGNGIGPLIRAVVGGPFGLDALLTARTESFQVAAPLTTGDRAIVWRALPDPGQWAVATLLWTGAGFGALTAAAARHRERRRI